MKLSNEIKQAISERLRKHRKDLNRYLLEVRQCQKGRLTKDKAVQMTYSYNRANQELAICDELGYLLKKGGK